MAVRASLGIDWVVADPMRKGRDRIRYEENHHTANGGTGVQTSRQYVIVPFPPSLAISIQVELKQKRHGKRR
jgi:hypothetical protein